MPRWYRTEAVSLVAVAALTQTRTIRFLRRGGATRLVDRLRTWDTHVHVAIEADIQSQVSLRIHSHRWSHVWFDSWHQFLDKLKAVFRDLAHDVPFTRRDLRTADITGADVVL